MLQKLKDFWEDCKAFFKYSETIFVARLTMFGGFLTAAVGAMDWSPVYNILGTDTGLTPHQATWLGITTFGKGMLDEYLRRRNATFPIA